ncbi:translocase [Salipiger sp.]|uniref:translocase n=1 Tax=Salipiger sp. TaxID=2078585 RepID=UPI003A97B117
MARLKTYLLAAATILAALAIGFVMQHMDGNADNTARLADPAEVEVASITDTSSVAPSRMPRLPAEAAVAFLPGARVDLVAADGAMPSTGAMPKESAAAGFDCGVTVEARPNAGALVDLTVAAPCYASERLTVHHHGLMFTQTLQPDGTLNLKVPALSEHALFIVAFDNGDGATASAEVPSLPFYDRIVLQWKGRSGLQLHAREYGSAYFTEGHIWSAAGGDTARAATGEGGFLIHLGNEDVPDALVADVYSFPAGTARRSGEIAMSVEAEVTATNCNTRVEAQTLELNAAESLRVRDLTLEMPDCDSVGDFLLLKNLIGDLTIAAR